MLISAGKYVISDGYAHLSAVNRLLWQYYEGIKEYVSHDLYQHEMNDLPEPIRLRQVICYCFTMKLKGSMRVALH